MFNIFDIGIILVLISFIIVGLKRGVIKELVSLVGIIIVFILSWALKGFIGNILCLYLPFFEFKGAIAGMSSINILIYQLIAFIFIFSILLGIYELSLKLSRIVQKIVNLTIILIIPSKILGALIALIEGYLLVFIVSVLLLIPLGKYDIYKDSTLINFMLYKTPVLSKCTNSFIDPLVKVSDIASNLSDGKITSKEANDEAIKIMVEYDIVDKDLINKLEEKKKI